MVNLYETDESVRDDNRPKHSTEDSVDHKANAANHIYNPDFSDIFQYKTQHDKQ